MSRVPLKWLASWRLAFVSLLTLFITAAIDDILRERHIAARCAVWNPYPDSSEREVIGLIILGIGIVQAIVGGIWSLVHVATRQKAVQQGDATPPGPVNFGYAFFIIGILVSMVGYGVAVFDLDYADKCLRYTIYEPSQGVPNSVMDGLLGICVVGVIIGVVWGLFSFFSNLERRRQG